MGQELSKTFEGKAPAKGAPYNVMAYIVEQSITGAPEPNYSNGFASGLGQHHLPTKLINLNLIQPKTEPSGMKRSRSQDRKEDEGAWEKQATIKKEETSESDQEESDDVSQVPPQTACLYHWEVVPRGDPYDMIPAIKNKQPKETKRIKRECQASMPGGPLLPIHPFHHNPSSGLSQEICTPSFERRPNVSYEIVVPNSNPMQEPGPGVTIVRQGRGVIMMPGNNEGLSFPEGFPYQFQWPLFNLHPHSCNRPDDN